MSSSTQDPIETIVSAAGNQPKTDAGSINSTDLERKLTEHDTIEEIESSSLTSDGPKSQQHDQEEAEDSKDDATAEPQTPSAKDKNTDHDSPSQPKSTTASTVTGRLPLHSHSSHLLSPASSLIFERNVQEPVTTMTTATTNDHSNSAIPAHITTDDQIPPVLEASSIALTSRDIDPDDVEIVTLAAHVPAMYSPSASTSALHQQPQHHSPLSPASSVYNDKSKIDEAQSYSSAAGNSPDPRRLSFISFADVVQGEQQADSSTSPRPGSSGFLVSSSSAAASPSLSAARARARSPMSSPSAATGHTAALSPPGSPGLLDKAATMRRQSSKSAGSGAISPIAMRPLSPGAEAAAAGLGLSAVDLVTERMSDAIRAVENA